MKPLGKEFTEIIKDLGLSERYRLESLRKDLVKIFPPPLGEHLYPSALNKGQLLMIVDSRAWFNEVRLHKEELERRLSPYGVESIRFRLGKVFRKKKGAGPPPLTRSLAYVPGDLVREVSEKIEDPHLRESLLKAMMSAFGKRQGR